MVFNRTHLFHFYVRNDYYIERIRDLLFEGISPNQQTENGNTPLHTAAESTTNNIGVIQELINAGADVNLVNSNGLVPLHYAVIFGKRDMIKVLLKSGADINAKTPYGNTALHFSIDNRGYEFLRQTKMHERFLLLKCIPDLFIISMLLQDKNIDVNPIGINGDTPLIWAVADGQILAVKLLLRNGANPNVRNIYGQSALHIAFSSSSPCIEIANLLLLHEASLSIKDDKNRTPIDVLINKIVDEQSLELAKRFVRMVVLHTNISEKFKKNLERHLELSVFQKKCSAEVENMKTEVISQNLTIHDFLLGCFNEDQFDEPVFDIYKPLVDMLMTERYPTYAYDIINGIEKRGLLKVLEFYLFLQHKAGDIGNMEWEELMITYKNRVHSNSASHWDLYELISAHANFYDKSTGTYKNSFLIKQ